MDYKLSTTQTKPVVYFATDHAGFNLKNVLLAFVRDELQYEVIDCGAHDLNKDDDYPDFIKVAAKAVSEDPEKRKAVIFGHTGQGEAMCANKLSGVRAAVYYGGSEEIITLSREHNDANVLSLSARFLDEAVAKEAVRLWLETTFSNEVRHSRRIKKLDLNTR